MAKASDTFIARAGDLSAGAKPTRQKTLWCASSTATLTADRDQWIISVAPLAAGAWVLAWVPSITIGLVGLANGSTYDLIACHNGTGLMTGGFDKIRNFWAKGSKIYLVSTGGIGILLTLEDP